MTSAGVKITILVDNQAGDKLIAEHGLSLWIETGGKNILFDTGQGNAQETNAQVLGGPGQVAFAMSQLGATTDAAFREDRHYRSCPA